MNICNLLEDLGGGSNFRINMDDEVIRGLVAVHQGRKWYIFYSDEQSSNRARIRQRVAAAPA